MRKRWKTSPKKSKRMFSRSARPVKKFNRGSKTGMGIKRGGTRL